MTTRARVEFDPMMFGVRIAVQRQQGDGTNPSVVLSWTQPALKRVTEAAITPNDATWLSLPEEDARAIYEALAEHFGHAGHDTRALRKDYDAERSRVDKLLTHLTTGASA